MMKPMLDLWRNMAMLTLESQRVIALRMVKLAVGGPAASREAHRMVTEKVFAAHSAGLDMATGAGPAAIVRKVRRQVRANARRLSK
jgi:hypothetical protein